MQDLPDLITLAAVMLILSFPLLAITFRRQLGRAFEERFTRRTVDDAALAALEARLNARFSQLEQNLDAVAIEVERIGETERYAAKLLASSSGREPTSPSISPPPIPRRVPGEVSARRPPTAT